MRNIRSFTVGSLMSLWLWGFFLLLILVYNTIMYGFGEAATLTFERDSPAAFIAAGLAIIVYFAISIMSVGNWLTKEA